MTTSSMKNLKLKSRNRPHLTPQAPNPEKGRISGIFRDPEKGYIYPLPHYIGLIGGDRLKRGGNQNQAQKVPKILKKSQNLGKKSHVFVIFRQKCPKKAYKCHIWAIREVTHFRFFGNRSVTQPSVVLAEITREPHQKSSPVPKRPPKCRYI